MIEELKIKNFVLIDEAHLVFDRGLTVLTGETGAGKSLLVKAFRMLLGERGGQNLIKPGAEFAEVEALIFGGEALVKRLEEIGFSGNEEIHIKRILTPQKQRIYLNGSPITLHELAKITSGLISLTSQHEYYTFLDAETQLNFLDEILGLKPLLRDYQNYFLQYRQLERELSQLKERVSQAALKRDFLSFQLRELEELNPDPQEEEALLKKRERLRNLTQLRDLVMSLSNALDETENYLSQALNLFQRLSRIESTFLNREKVLHDLFFEVKELKRDLYALFSELPEDESSLEEIEGRLAKYEKLKKKYGRDTAGLLKLKEELKEELSLLESGEEALEALIKEKERLERILIDKALKLSEERKKGIFKLRDLIKEELKALGFFRVEFEIEVRTKEPISQNFTSTGLDEVEFLFSPNPGQPLRPLEKIASGGELSRIFLAFKTLLNKSPFVEAKEKGTLIFDEVDTGIGGETAIKVGEKLKELSQNFQVICITHLPQIARMADYHYVVEKHLGERETKTTFRLIEGEERLKEIARMLGDSENLELARKFLGEVSHA